MMLSWKQGRRPVKMEWWSLVLIVILPLWWTSSVEGQAQHFVTRPVDTSVIRGSTAVLKCVIGNRKGAVQWAKDGFSLGFNSSIPGYDRYTMLSTHENEFNLMIVSTQLSDDATYACQVLPGGGDRRLQARASLTVRVPCEPPQIMDYNNNSIVEVPYTQTELTLTCKSKLGRPAATIEWYKDGQKVTSAITNSIEPSSSDKRETAVSAITIPLSQSENDKRYECQATNSAILGAPMRTSVKLSIMFPPGPPQISGYTNGRVVKANDTLILKCMAREGNPSAAVTWYRNTEPVDWSFGSKQNQSTNLYTFTVKPADNNAVYRCEVKNLVTLQPLTAQYNLTVYFPPTRVVMSGASQPVKANRQVTLTCVTSNSNPKASVIWFAKNSPVAASRITETSRPSPDGGFVTTSQVRIQVSHQDHRTVYTCQATNSEFGQTVADTHTLSVLYPPNVPEISGYNEGNTVRAGHLERITCISVGGNPVATLKWYKGNKLIDDSSYRAVGNIASSEIAIVLDADDNGATYKCKASNLATATPLQATVRLTVYFPPSQVFISMSTTEPMAGEPMDLTCVCSSSNPAAEITWIKNGRRMIGVDLGSVNAENGGKNTTSRLRIKPTSKDNDAVFGCRATNRVLDQSQTDAVTLNVKFKPEFDEIIMVDEVDTTQGEKTVIKLTAIANPPTVTYSLMKNGAAFALPSRFQMSPQGILTISSANKADKGTYAVKAENPLGFAIFNFTMNVKFPAIIVAMTNRQTKNEGETAEFSCQVEANPVIPNIVTWSRSDSFDMSRTSVRVAGDTSYLTVPDLTKEDGGTFKCAADNRIGSPATKTAKLVVKFSPIIDKSTEISRSAGEIGSTISLLCKAAGAPDVTLSWTRNNEAIRSGSKYRLSSDKSGKSFQSKLKIKDLDSSDYGAYICTATNSKGSDSHSVTVSGTRKPYPPKSIRGDNVTSSTINVSWKPGFNGGLPQSFRVRYKPTEARGYMYVDVRPYGATSYKITGLELGTQYEITVKAFNDKGESLYLARGIVVSTSDTVTPADIATSEFQESDELPVIIILVVCIVGVFILTLNIGLILFFIRRRKKRLENGTSDTTSHTNTFELYGNSHKGDNSIYPPPSDDTRSFGTYDYDKSYDDFSDDYIQNTDKDYNRPYSPPHKILESPRMGGRKQTYIDDNVSIGRSSPWNEVSSYKPPRYGTVNGDIYDYKSNKHVGMNELSDRPSSRPSSRTGKTPPPPPPLRSSSSNTDNQMYKGSSSFTPCSSSSADSNYHHQFHHLQQKPPPPPLPSRNYSPQEVSCSNSDSLPPPPPRYVPVPGSSSVLSPNIVANPHYNGPNPPTRTPSPNDTLPAGSEFRGHLV